MKKPKKPPPLSWEPRLSADRRTYCSPACGAGCRKFAHAVATKCAAALCQQLGAGWTPKVWENLGWHWGAVSACGRWKVHGHGGHYSAFLGRPESGGRWAGGGKTPRAAIKAAWRDARAAIAEVSAFETARPAWVREGARIRWARQRARRRS